jgi:Fe-S-cluster containining protein
MFTTGSPQNDAAIESGIIDAVLRGAPIFAGKDAEERLSLARKHIDALVPVASQKAAKDLGRPIACREGCSACCVYSKRVALLPIELRRIIDRVEQQGQLEEVARRAEIRRARGKGACPLLSRDGRCSVYAERPLSCRRYHSLSRQDCESGENPKVTWIGPLVAAGMALIELARWRGDELVDLFEDLPTIAAARLKQARKRQRRVAREGGR